MTMDAVSFGENNIGGRRLEGCTAGLSAILSTFPSVAGDDRSRGGLADGES